MTPSMLSIRTWPRHWGQLTADLRIKYWAATLVGALDEDAANTRYYGLATMS
jgi:hypothetical protein